MLPRSPQLAILRAIIIILVLAAGVAAQEGQPTQSQPAAEAQASSSDTISSSAPIAAPTLDEVQARIAEVEADASLDDAAKAAFLAPLRAAVDSLKARDAAVADRQQFLDATAAAPATIERLQQELDRSTQLPELEDFDLRPPEEALEALRALLREAEAIFEAAATEQADLKTEADRREVRLGRGPTELVSVRDRLAEARTSLAALPGDPTDPLAEARRWQLAARAVELEARVASLDAELASYTARRELLPMRRALAQRKAALASAAIDRLEESVADAANRVAVEAQQKADQQASEVADPELQRLAEATSQLAAKQLGPDGTLANLEWVRARESRIDQDLTNLQRRARSTAARVRAAGLTEVVGASLREELRRLVEPDTRAIARLDGLIGAAQLELIDVEDLLAELGSEDLAKARITRRLARDDQPLPRRIEQQLASIVDNYVQTLRKLEVDFGDLYDESLELRTKEAQLAEKTKLFREYIEERILWTRSVQGNLLPRASDLRSGGIWLLGGETVPPQGLPGDSSEGSSENVPLGTRWLEAVPGLWPPSLGSLFVLLALVGSFGARRYATRSLERAASEVRRFSTDRMSLTLMTLPLTLALGLPITLSLVLAGLLLADSGTSVAEAVGASRIQAAILVFGLESLRHMARADGLAEAHFRWRREGLVHLRRSVFWLEVVFVPLLVIARAFSEQPDATLDDGLGRVAFIAAQLVFAAFLARLFAPWLPFIRSYTSKHAKSLANQTRWLWYPLLGLSPIAMAVLAALGFYYSAVQLDQRLYLTAWLLASILIAYSMVLRWLFIERRRLLIQRAQQKREAEKEEQLAAGGEVEGIEFETPAELDAAEVDTQTRRVLSAVVLASIAIGMYALWAQQLPALRMLDRVQLYPQVQLIDVEAQQGTTPALAGDVLSGADETDQPSAVSPSPTNPLGFSNTEGQSEPIRAITLADVGLALIFFALTWILARNLPGLLEITLLKRLPLDAGARFAVTSILRYFIGIAGIVLGFGAIGIGWSQVQFLAAALTFGLAFGLQEIFANFISGLIILVERPVRVGDTVTVNGIDGRVTRIRMRATTVLDWELRELVIPNKVFITDHFINWTLSDPRIRVTVPVGVSYGSDVRLVQRTLLDSGQGYEHVVAEPRVRSLFLGFGDNTLDFQLRIFIEHFDYYIDAKSYLHMEICERFRELDIEISFPQRDLHIRDIGPLADVLSPRERDDAVSPEDEDPKRSSP